MKNPNRTRSLWILLLILLALGLLETICSAQTNAPAAVVPTGLPPSLDTKTVIIAILIAWGLRELNTIGAAGGLIPVLWYSIMGVPPKKYPEPVSTITTGTPSVFIPTVFPTTVPQTTIVPTYSTVNPPSDVPPNAPNSPSAQA